MVIPFKEPLIKTGRIKLRCKKIRIKAGNAGNRRSMAKFFKAFAPAHAPRQRSAGDEDTEHFVLKLVGYILIRGSTLWFAAHVPPKLTQVAIKAE